MGRTARRARRRNDRGAVLLEFALVVPFLCLMVFGTVEMGLAWTAKSRVQSAVATATRVGASVGANANADRTILVALRAALSSEALANLDRVVIYKSTAASGTVPANCIQAVGSQVQTGVSASCNTYTGGTVRSVTSSTSLGAADDYWSGTTRVDSLAGTPDSLGLYIRTTYAAKTGLLFNSLTFTHQNVFRLQPDIDG
ncbi:MAG: pilus assembly protein [Acidimicrobiia bacterium]|nr:pilus assembly protein [Acidimicrobiia bacterium]